MKYNRGFEVKNKKVLFNWINIPDIDCLVVVSELEME